MLDTDNLASLRATGLRQRSFIYLANPAIKFITILTLSVALIWLADIRLLAALSVFYLALYLILVRLSWQLKIKLLLIILIVAFFSGINLFLFGKGTSIIWQFAWWKISYESINFGLIVVLRTLIMSSLTLIFATTTSPVLFCYALMQQFKLSPNIAYGCLAAIRMLPLMRQDFAQLQKALKVRGFKRQKGITKYWQWLNRVMLVLLAQAIRRSYRTSLAVVTKQFKAKAKRTYFYQTKLSSNDFYFLLLILLGNLAIIYALPLAGA